PRGRGPAGGGARIRRGGERPQAHRPRGFQPCQRGGSRGAVARVIPSFRWFGPADPIPLAHIRQIPGVTGIVSALYDLPVGAPWGRERLGTLKAQIEDAGLRFAVVESIPVHENIKLGRRGRDRLIEDFCHSVCSMGELGIPVLCYNFMPVFDWTRTDLALRLPDGSTALAYDDAALANVDRSRGAPDLPGWATAYQPAERQALIAAYREVGAERLWDNLAYFLERVVPVAREAGVRLAIHPDDPPWPIFGLPRIITNAAALERLVALVDSPVNGVTFCTGSLGADPANDLPAMVRRLGALGENGGRIHFAHCRNVLVPGAERGMTTRIGYRWTVCALLFVVTTINYIDRQVLGILAPTLQRELHWTESQYGDVVSWFSLVYAFGFLAAGRVLDRVGVRRG